MDGLWTFSASNQALLQKLIDNAPPADDNNEWAKKLNFKHYGRDVLKRNVDKHSEDQEHSVQRLPETVPDNIPVVSLPTYSEKEKNLCEVIETDLVANFSVIADECTKNPSLFTAIANNVTMASIEKFCRHICTEEMNEKFVIGYLEIFLPTFLVKQSPFALELLIQASKTYSQLFRLHFLPIILRNTTISNNVLYGFIQSLDNKEKCLEAISQVTLNLEAFQHHILSIYTLYKDSGATSYVNRYIYTCIKEFHENFTNDINFGRLLLAFVQMVSEQNVDTTELENIVECHRSAFGKPCMNKFKIKFKSQ